MSNWIKQLKLNPLEWLLESNPWTKFRTLTDLLEKPSRDIEVERTKAELLADEKIVSLAKETKNWITIAPTRNSDPKISYYKLRMLADFGLSYQDLELEETVTKASSHIIDDMYAVRGELPKKLKKGEPYVKPDLTADVWHISPCNSPVISYALHELGVQNDSVFKSIQTLKNKWTDKKGWFCNFFFVESQFKKLQVGCPIAGLQALDIFSRIPELKESSNAQNAFKPIKFHKDYGKTLYYFGRSKKFWTFKYPFTWYNALYLADVLTRFDFLKKEPVVQELIEWIIKSQDENGKFTPTSISLEYKGWDFSDKKNPSPWITFLCCRILKQYLS